MSALEIHQVTIRRRVSVCGRGLHTGAIVKLTLIPAEPDYGIRFCRIDLPGKPVIPASCDYVIDTSLATTLGLNGARISTVEHLLAVIRGLGIDNIHVNVDGPEIPILDGSAAPFVEIIQSVGLQRQLAVKKLVRVEIPVSISEGDAFVRVWPSERPLISYTIEYPHPLIGKQCFSSEIEPNVFIHEVAPARTFGFLHEVRTLQRNGRALGGSLENALVFDDQGVVNPEGMRYEDECVRHKILDLMGDMALCPFPLIGRFEAHKAGHRLHLKLMKTIARYAEAWLVPAIACPVVLSSRFFADFGKHSIGLTNHLST